MTFTVAVIRKAAMKAARYGAVKIAEKVPGSTAARVLANIDTKFINSNINSNIELILHYRTLEFNTLLHWSNFKTQQCDADLLQKLVRKFI